MGTFGKQTNGGEGRKGGKTVFYKKAVHSVCFQALFTQIPPILGGICERISVKTALGV